MKNSETHVACNNRLKKEKGRALCCECYPHEGCNLASKVFEPTQTSLGGECGFDCAEDCDPRVHQHVCTCIGDHEPPQPPTPNQKPTERDEKFFCELEDVLNTYFPKIEEEGEAKRLMKRGDALCLFSYANLIHNRLLAQALKQQREGVESDLEQILQALCDMYSQYCSRDGHLFMSAGERASTVLEELGMLNPDEAGRGEPNYEAIPRAIKKILIP